MAEVHATPEFAAAALAIKAQINDLMARIVACGLSPAEVERLLVGMTGRAACFCAGASKALAGSPPPSDAHPDDMLEWVDKTLARIRNEIEAELRQAAARAFPEVQGHG
ncbi:hypothetical protein [Ancylobacter mangrovi]|uniref:hypothetical protein n=1 Tax=Ancylobacter mangrovi TaxID=2972472 RepID=UPI002162A6F1|nr:hypothetical protein [Ancylobacter mangrovi]MCS0501577.1 hypothetical protein [Ancylobacter mangrovi]